jgi:uncharacterized membrane protein YiaA
MQRDAQADESTERLKIMFNLNEAIADWRRVMAAAGIKSRDVLDELESHLREDVEEQMRGGITAEQAFQEAVRRVGAGNELRQEFGKVSWPRPQSRRKIIPTCCLATAVFVFAVETWTLIIFDITPVERILGVALISLIAAYIGALPYLNRRLVPGVRGWALRKTIATTCNFAAVLWVGLLFLGLANITLLPSGIVLSAVCWGLCAAATMTVVTFAHDTDLQMLDLYSPAVWRSLEIADAEAVRFHHDFIGTEHVLLGLIQEEHSSVPTVLGKMGVRCETVREEIEKIVGSGPQSTTSRAPVYTPRAKKAIAIAIQEARDGRQNHVEAEHIFLGLLREGGGVAAKVLAQLGVNATIAREEIQKAAAHRKDENE